jgi:hypothetical protein
MAIKKLKILIFSDLAGSAYKVSGNLNSNFIYL